MTSVITAPTGQAGFAAALLDPDHALPPDLIAHNGSDPTVRFAVYRNNVLVSLVSALKATFPVTAELVGDAFFGAMAAVYVRAAPPRARYLASYGADFPAFIRAFEPASAVPYLADVAALERARLDVYHAADEDALSAEAVADAVSTLGAAIRFRFIAAHAVVRSLYAIHSLFAAHQGALAIETVDPFIAEAVLIHRVDDEVMITRLAPGDAAFLHALSTGATLADAAADAVGADPTHSLPHALAALMRARLIAATFEG